MRSTSYQMVVLIEIYGVNLFGLPDSRSTVSTVGGKAWNKLNNSNRTLIIGRDNLNKLQNPQLQLALSVTKHVKVANGQTCPVLGRLDASVFLDRKMKVCSLLLTLPLKMKQPSAGASTSHNELWSQVSHRLNHMGGGFKSAEKWKEVSTRVRLNSTMCVGTCSPTQVLSLAGGSR